MLIQMRPSPSTHVRVLGAAVIASSIALLSAAYVVNNRSMKSSGPVLQVEPETLELSTRDSVVQAEVIIKNVGDDLLVIEGCDSTCGCLESVVKALSVRPGQYTSMHLKFQAPPVGSRAVAITVRSNDPIDPARRIVATVSREKDVPYVVPIESPGAFSSVVDTPSETLTVRVVTYENVGDQPWVQAVRSDVPSLDASISVEETQRMRDPLFVRRRYRIELKPKDDAPVGCHSTDA
jgi:hypothetical protein